MALPPRVPPSFLKHLTDICNLPTAPYAEHFVLGHLLQWASHYPQLQTRRDAAGNLYIEYRPATYTGPADAPLVVAAHMDHPGFTFVNSNPDGTLNALFRGGVKPSHFADAKVKFWLNTTPHSEKVAPSIAHGHWVHTCILSVGKEEARVLPVTLAPISEQLLPNAIGMWDLPDAAILGNQFAARVCDDLAGVAAIVCLLETLIQQKIDTHVLALFTRAEEVGFAGTLAVCELKTLPQNSRIVGLENSKALPNARQADGPIIRVGDKAGLFSPGLTHFLVNNAGYLTDADASFKHQRKLMDGGTCESTAFTAWGYDAAAMCLALGNYHNMILPDDAAGTLPSEFQASPLIGSEFIDLSDFYGMVQILTESAKRLSTYQPNFAVMKDRLSKMHREEQKEILYRTSDTHG